MSYIGKEPTVGNFQKCDAISVVNGQATYALTVGGSAVFPESSNHVLCSLNGILQSPQDSFTISSSNIVFASNLVTGDVIDFVMILGNVLDLGVPSDNTVSASKLTNDIISGQTELASEPADTDEFLVSDAGTIKRIDYSLIKGGGITEADQWRLSANFQHSGSGETTINSNWERTDTYDFSNLGSGMTESSGIFTFPSTGYYLIMFNGYFDDASTTIYAGIRLRITTDNSTYNVVENCYSNIPNTNSHANNQIMYIADISNVSTHKARFDIHAGASARLAGSTSTNNTAVKFIKLADT